jgi:hypothetical protein
MKNIHLALFAAIFLTTSFQSKATTFTLSLVPNENWQASPKDPRSPRHKYFNSINEFQQKNTSNFTRGSELKLKSGVIIKLIQEQAETGAGTVILKSDNHSLKLPIEQLKYDNLANQTEQLKYQSILNTFSNILKKNGRNVTYLSHYYNSNYGSAKLLFRPLNNMCIMMLFNENGRNELNKTCWLKSHNNDEFEKSVKNLSKLAKYRNQPIYACSDKSGNIIGISTTS